MPATSPPKGLLHALLQESRDRVAYVRAGQPLTELLESGLCGAGGPGFPAIPVQSSLAKHPHKHHATRLSSEQTKKQPLPLTSYAQYDDYMGAKPTDHPIAHLNTRRRGVTLRSKQLKKLLSTSDIDLDAAADARASGKAKLTSAFAALRSHHAFFNIKELPPVEETYQDIKNPHMAFLEFKKDALPPVASTPRARHVKITELNAPTHQPLRFGDQICLISMASDLPLAIGRDGRTLAVANAVVGQHVIFTITDFRHPTRHDDILVGEDFWLRVDETQLNLPPPDEVMALVADTSYFLGCPGYFEAASPSRHRRQVVSSASAAAKYSHVTNEDEQDAHDRRTFKLVTMKAMRPSKEVYGDDAATREYTLESNPSVVLLAKWRFVMAKVPSQKSENTRLVLNCASVSLQLSTFTLEYDGEVKRGVLRENGEDERRLHLPAAQWQVRLVRRPEYETEDPGSLRRDGSPATRVEQQRMDEKASLEWIARHHEQLAERARRRKENQVLVKQSRHEYDRVVEQSDAQLVQIQRAKAEHYTEYCQNRSIHGQSHHQHKKISSRLTKNTEITLLPRL
ncbi:hypothetical protein Poli38472_003405 [Pythium oligandrum]|uniref:Uncharacterized protein n=1 Tax=Pythium oligandrum TaxID=41045 RepID=A0A8K1FBP0_PYTOL|nr:hypothetical protein Poli38472_003405 [Pythium oligandrum]|eukprot:TMW57480.1 hypothetical protein Poli38472_003405 [Pythium oligandrum]